MKRNKRVLPLLASITLLSGPVLLVVACNHEISRYPAALPNDEQNRILFDFVGVNYSVNAKSQFSTAFTQGIEFIKKQVEGIMAQQEFYNIFVQKLGYTPDKANETFNKIKDNLGLNLLAADYLNTVNSGQNFDNKVYASKLIFQTDNWHQFGTRKFDYSQSEFYGKEENNPDKIFTPSFLYSDLDDVDKTNKIIEVAKYADENYNKELEALTKEKQIWSSPTTPPQLAPSLGDGPDAIKEYQQKLERFKWWLRFRYQQYYYATILPQLNETLFTMANIFDSILRFTKNSSGKPVVDIDNSKYAVQLQDWGPSAWTSKYRWVWEYTISKNAAENINRQWTTDPSNPPLPDLMSNATTLNPDFFNRLAASDKALKNTVDPILGINSFVNDTSGKAYDNAIKTNNSRNNSSNWADNPDGTHYWGKDNKGTFVYSAPIYWIDVIQNLNFNYYNDPINNPIVVSGDYKGLISRWNNAENSAASNSNFSQYLRANNMPNPGQGNYNSLQEMKWNTLWQMIYFLASQADSNPNKEIAKDNFTTAAKSLFPKYIKKESIYNDTFWKAVSSYY